MDGFWWIHESAALSAACQCLECHSISNTQTVQMCLFFMEYGAIGRGQGTRHFCVWPCFTPLAFPPSTNLPCRKKMGLTGREPKLLAGPPAVTVLQMGPAVRMQSQNSMGSVPRPSGHSLHAAPSVGSSGLLWNMSKLSSHHAAICSSGASLI